MLEEVAIFGRRLKRQFLGDVCEVGGSAEKGRVAKVGPRSVERTAEAGAGPWPPGDAGCWARSVEAVSGGRRRSCSWSRRCVSWPGESESVGDEGPSSGGMDGERVGLEVDAAVVEGGRPSRHACMADLRVIVLLGTPQTLTVI